MAAPAFNDDRVLCEKCLQTVSPSNLACEEPNCPIKGLAAGERADSAVYTDLARANLMRMRGNYAEARELCLSILRRHPGNVTAHTLLGDLCAEQGDLSHAAEWYELALDLDPTSAADRAKLEEVRRRIQTQEVADTAKQIGIPDSAPRARLYLVLVTVFVVVVGVAAFFLGQALRDREQPAAPPMESIALDEPIEKRTEPMPTAPGSATVPPEAGIPGQTPANPTPAGPRDDAELLAQAKALPEGGRVTGAWLDPRDGAVVLTFAVEEGIDPAVPALALGRAVLAARAAAPKAVLRAQQGDAVIYVADLERANLPPDGQDPPEGAKLLTNEWRR